MSSKQCFEVVSEDTVQCKFFPTTAKAQDLQNICEAINKTIQTLTAGYIWHRDEFRVHVPIHNLYDNDQPVHLVSSTCFGDNIEDEWLIVYIILELTKQFKDLIVQMWDNDGDFLLIEAADCLPSWANPDSTENRVFLYQNQIHMIPPTLITLECDIKLQDAIKIVTENSEETASAEIYEAVLSRVSGYPDKMNMSIHEAIVKLPIHIATLLIQKPSIISPIVSAYCNHDDFEAKIFKNVKFEDCIVTKIKFTKCLYAMLIHSKLTKSVKHIRVKENDKRSALGLKLSCGYEMIMSKLTGDVFSSKEFHNFTKKLTGNGYFKDNLEGSKDYKQLLANAKEFFLNMKSPISLQICNSIMQLRDSKEFAEIKERLEKEQSSIECLTEDSDDWLNINPDELNNLLNSRYGKNAKFQNNESINSEKITSELSKFLKQTSNYEGIETKDTEEDDSEEENIEFDSEQFIDSLKNMMNIVSGDNNNDLELDSDDFSDMDGDILDEQELDMELKAKLKTDKTYINPGIHSLIQSVKEEEGSSGPSSNIFKTIGINKTDLMKMSK